MTDKKLSIGAEIGILQKILLNMEKDPFFGDDIKIKTTLSLIKTVVASLEAKQENIDEIIRIAREEHIEHIGEFSKGMKISMAGLFVIDEIEAILQKMILVGCKQSHKEDK